MGLLDLIFPKYCVNCKKYGDYLCSDCFSRLSFDTKNICLVCGKHTYNGLTHPVCLKKYSPDGSFTALVFNPVSKKLIYSFKYKPHLTGLSKFLGDLFYESLIQNEEFNKILRSTQNDIFFVPIPLSSSKYRKRGYNQAEILAKELSKKFGFTVVNCLERVRDTKSQVGLNKEERHENMAEAFRLKERYINYFTNKNIALVDDVLTTGATLAEAGKVLKKSGTKRFFELALAREQ